MSVMFTRFFGIPQSFIRLGIVKKLSGAAILLYIALLHESERYCTRELIRTVAQLGALVGGAPNSYAKARKELVRAGLMQIEPYGREGFVFHLCDPTTGNPWPGHPQERIVYTKKNTPLSPRAEDHSAPAPARKRPKMDDAGISFNFGHNEAKHESTLPSPDVSTVARRYDFDF
jgi:hypothetical protein